MKLNQPIVVEDAQQKKDQIHAQREDGHAPLGDNLEAGQQPPALALGKTLEDALQQADEDREDEALEQLEWKLMSYSHVSRVGSTC